jgi:hypothetical protein
MAQGRRRAQLIQGLQLQAGIRTGDLENAILQFLATGDPGVLGFLNVRGEQFPTGLTFEDLGLPAGFTVTPPAGELLESAFAAAPGFLGGTVPGARESALLRALSGEPALELDPALREEFFRTNVEQPALEIFEQQTLPAIASRFLGTGQTGAARQAAAVGARGLSRDIAGLRSQFLRSDEELRARLADTALERALRGIPASLEAQLRPVSALAQLGGIERAIGGGMRGEALLRALLAQPFSDPRLGLFGAISGNVPLMQLGLSGIQNLGGLISGASGLGSLLTGGF